jgi:putative component of membrane protein insertase Oxa1/YidC/SpoIIIJ protein YidD
MNIGANGVGVYRKHISKDFNSRRGCQCGYHCSCSAYAKEALSKDGLKGILPTIARLRKCNGENQGHMTAEFLRYAANCPDAQISDFFDFDSEANKKDFLVLREQLLSSASMIAAAKNGQSAALEQATETYQNAMNTFMGRVHFTIDDPVGDKTGPRHFKLMDRRPAEDIVKADRGFLGNTLRQMAGVATGAIGGVFGAVGGLFVGAAIGVYDGTTSGLGLGDVVSKRSEKKYGKGAQGGTAPLRKLAEGVHSKLQKSLGIESLSSIVGGAVGLAAGLVGGAVGGVLMLGQMGAELGKVLGTNVGDEILAKVLPSQGEVVVAKAHSVPTPTLKTENQDPKGVAESLWRVLANTPEAFRGPRVRAEGATPWQFAVFSDATAANIESQEIRRMVEFERELPESTTARVHLRRGSLIPRRFKKWLTVAGLGASIVGLSMIGGTAGIPLAVSLLSKTKAVANGVEAVKEIVRDSNTDSESHWNGRKVFELSGPLRENNAADSIQSAPVATHRSASAVSLQKLARDLEASFSGEGPRVAVFAGHANSFDSIAGYKPKVLGEALSLASESSGKETDLVVVEACNAATIEALEPLAKGARYALVSQLPMAKAGLPWHYILSNIDSLGANAKDLGESIVSNFGGAKTLPTLSLIDLKALPELKAELGNLADLLPTKGLAESLSAGHLSQVREEGVVKKLRRKLSSFEPGSQSIDLAKVLEALSSQVTTKAGQEQLEKTKAAYKKCVVTAKGHGLGGLSIEGPSPFFDRKHYQEETGMNQWGALLGQNQPTVLKPLARAATVARELGVGLKNFKKEILFGKAE